MNLALIGCGRMGQQHLKAASQVEGLRVVAAVDPATPIPLASAKLNDALADGVDCVLVASPTSTHEVLVRMALESGKHVLCEKPLTLDPDRDLDLGRLAECLGLNLQIGFWRRFAEPFLRLREVLASGAIGRATTIRAAQWDANPPPAAFCDPLSSGGIEVDCGVHEFDLARWILGSEPLAVAADAPLGSERLVERGDVETVFGLVRLTRGQTMAVDLTRTAGHRDSIRTEVIGTAGAAIVEFDETGIVAVRSENRLATTLLTASDAISDALQEQLRTFNRGIAEGRLDPDAAGAEDSARAIAAGQALRRARIEGGWCETWPTTAAQLNSAP